MKKPTREQVREVVGFVAGTAASTFVSAAGALVSLPAKGFTKFGIKVGAVICGLVVANKVSEHIQEMFDTIMFSIDKSAELMKKYKNCAK